MPVQPAAPELRLALTEALATLPAKARAIVVLRYWEDMSIEQVAALLGCSEGNVKSQSARALCKLRDRLGGTLTDAELPGQADDRHEPRKDRHGTVISRRHV